MTTSHRDASSRDTPHETTERDSSRPVDPTAAELEDMSQPELARLAAELDDVEIVHNTPRWPVPGTRAERRAEHAVGLWFIISALSALAFLVCYLFWPFEYVEPGRPGYWPYALYTPLIGGFFGLCVLTLGIAVISYVKKFFPDEVSVQQRHDGPSTELARKTVMAQLAAAGKDTGIARRKLIIRSAGAAAGIFGLGLGVAAIAPLVRNPWKGGPKAALWTTGWAPNYPGEVVYIRADTGDPHDIKLVRPEDQGAGSMQTVFPFRESERDDEHALSAALKRADNPVMLIRLRPGTPVIQAPGQENYHYGDFYAYSKICTHLGCPTSLYESADPAHPLPVPPVAVHRHRVREAGFRSRGSPAPPTSDYRERRGLPHRHGGLLRPDRTGLLGAWESSMSSITTPTNAGAGLAAKAGAALDELDQRYHPAAGLRKQFNKVFPTHWSFMLGEVALYCFIVLLLSGTYLGLFFDPSMMEVVYDGLFTNLRGVEMSTAYASALHISFDVRGGLFMRQIHHWAALLFVVSMVAHMFRTFFTGAFRKPREANWVIGLRADPLGMVEGFPATRCPTTCCPARACASRRASRCRCRWSARGRSGRCSAVSSPAPRSSRGSTSIHMLLMPGIMLALIGVHVGLVWYQKHTQFPGPGRTEDNVIGVRMLPAFAAKGGALLRRHLRHDGPCSVACSRSTRSGTSGRTTRPRVRGLPAGLLHGLVGRHGPTVARLGDRLFGQLHAFRRCSGPPRRSCR